MAKVIAVDPGMTARILRIANSAFCNFAARITTVQHAMSLLGTQQIHDLVLATSVIDCFSKIPDGLLDMRKFWHRSVTCGCGAKLLAESRDLFDSERLFTAGLLTHIGRLVLYLRRPEIMRQAQSDFLETGIPVQQTLESELGFDDAAVGGEFLSAWNLPESLAEPVRYYTHPSRAKSHTLEAAILHIASAIADSGAVDTAEEDLIRQLDETAWSSLEMSRPGLLDLKSQSENLVKEIAEQFMHATV